MEKRPKNTKVVQKMRKKSYPSAIFVSSRISLEKGGGGVQWCTREYLETIHFAGISTHIIPTEPPRDWPTRLIRKLFPHPYRGSHAPGLFHGIFQAADREKTNLIFLNNTDAAAIAPSVKNARPNLKLIFLSHGSEITDVVNNLRVAPGSMPACQKDSRWLGELLKKEIAIREVLDGVLCISQEDVSFERWLGSQRVQYIPRQISSVPLELKPVKGRIGTVGALDHGPNLHGLRHLADALSRRNGIDLHVVGGPEKIGLSLQDKFKGITYLGRLSEEDLKKEAASWCAFVNPIFCNARGASTKVATALGWGLPVLTTSMGARGYVWDKELIPFRETPPELAAECRHVAESDNLGLFFQKAHQLAKLAPSVEQAAAKLVNFLGSLHSS